jgi:hypothetical protein
MKQRKNFVRIGWEYSLGPRRTIPPNDSCPVLTSCMARNLASLTRAHTMDHLPYHETQLARHLIQIQFPFHGGTSISSLKSGISPPSSHFNNLLRRLQYTRTLTRGRLSATYHHRPYVEMQGSGSCKQFLPCPLILWQHLRFRPNAQLSRCFPSPQSPRGLKSWMGT